MQFLLPLSRSRSQTRHHAVTLLLPIARLEAQAIPLTADRPTDTAVPHTVDRDSTPGSYSLAFQALALDTKTDPRLTKQPVLFAFFVAGLTDRLPGTGDWSISRDCSRPHPIGCRHVSPTDTLRALGGASSERGRKKKKTTSRHTTTV